jgi:hypothetical protein
MKQLIDFLHLFPVLDRILLVVVAALVVVATLAGLWVCWLANVVVNTGGVW